MSNREHILIDVETLAYLDKTNLVLLDATVILEKPQFDGDYQVRSGFSAWQQQHIDGSAHVDQYQRFVNDQANYSFAVPTLETVQQFLNQFNIQHHSTIVIYDTADGIWAARLWWVLRSFGIDSRILNGGLLAWKNADYAIVQADISQIQSGQSDIQAHLNSIYWADLTEVEHRITLPSSGLICALGTEQFTGQALTRYARRGAIPNSQNIPARLFINAENKLVDDETILKILENYDLDQELHVLYCGGGISACLLAVAMSIVGLDSIAIYDGSLQEWAQHPHLPLIGAH